MSTVAANLERVKKTIEDLTGDPAAVVIVGVTKSQPLPRVQEAVDAGLARLANNYAQEGEQLMRSLAGYKGRWDFIGHIQSKKVKYLSDYDCVQSLDRLEIASLLDKRLTSIGKRLSVLVEVNVGEEKQKSGIAPDELENFLKHLEGYSALKVVGLMAMPPFLNPVERRRPFFQAMRKLYDKFKGEYSFEFLSMGTSDDYRIAVQEGANMIRLGTLLFGKR